MVITNSQTPEGMTRYGRISCIPTGVGAWAIRGIDMRISTPAGLAIAVGFIASSVYVAAPVAVSAHAGPGSSATRTYEQELLPGLNFTGHGGSAATDINDRGVAVGHTETLPDSCCSGWAHAVVWHDGQITDLGTLSRARGSRSSANAINEAGVVVGWSWDPREDPVAAQWEDGAGRQLWAPGEATDINDGGTVVGTSDGKAVVWRRGKLRELPGLGGESAATAVNNKGVVAGWSESISGERHAVVWRRMAGWSTSGQARPWTSTVGGWWSARRRTDGAVAWKGTSIRPLGLQGIAHAVSDSGLVAGVVFDSSRFAQAFVWDKGHVTLVAEAPVISVDALNDQGVVAGAIGGNVGRSVCGGRSATSRELAEQLPHKSGSDKGCPTRCQRRTRPCRESCSTRRTRYTAINGSALARRRGRTCQNVDGCSLMTLPRPAKGRQPRAGVRRQ
jgi:probable HAF family extracellular repeat protein